MNPHDSLKPVISRGTPRGPHDVLAAARSQAVRAQRARRARRRTVATAISIATLGVVVFAAARTLDRGADSDRIITHPASTASEPNAIRCTFDHHDHHAAVEIPPVLGTTATTVIETGLIGTADIATIDNRTSIRVTATAPDGTGAQGATGDLGVPRADTTEVLAMTGADGLHINCSWTHVDTTLRDALTHNDIDLARHPALAALDETPYCGTITITSGGSGEIDPTTANARRCFLDAVLEHRAVTTLQRYRTTNEPAPYRFEVTRSRPDGRFDIIALDTTADAVNAAICTGITANELLNASPEPPYDPGFYKIYSCDADNHTAIEPLGVPQPTPPAWFTTRPQLPSCGTAPWQPVDNQLYIARRLSTGATSCVTDAIALQRPAEIGFGRTDRPDSPARWFRIEADRTAHVIDAADPADPAAVWQEYRCAALPISPDGAPQRGPLPKDCTRIR